MRDFEYETFREDKKHTEVAFPYNTYLCSIPLDFSSVPVHWHEEMEFIVVKKGRGLVTLDRESRLLEAGQALIVLPGQLHGIRQYQQERMEYENIIFRLEMLLPKEVDEEGEEVDPRAELVARLLEYKRYKILAEELADREENAAGHFYKASSLPPEVAKYRPPTDLDELLDGLTLAKLQRIFEQVMKRKEYKVDPIRSKFGTIHREPVSLEQKITSVMDYARKARRFSFRQLLEKQTDKLEVVVTFLAVLELMKIGKIHLTQEETFGEMDIETIEPEGQEEDLNLEQVSDLV